MLWRMQEILFEQSLSLPKHQGKEDRSQRKYPEVTLLRMNSSYERKKQPSLEGENVQRHKDTKFHDIFGEHQVVSRKF